MSSYSLVKFVDSPVVGATVRLDLNDRAATAPRGVEADFDPGVPTLEGDPDAVGQQWGFRSPKLTVQIKGTKANALAFVSNLSKEMLRRTNWLMFQLNAATAPVWFKTYRTGYQPLSLEQVFGNTTTGGNAPPGYPDVWRVEVPLVADAFMYGAQVNLSQVTLQNLPGGSNPLRYVLPALKGDAPTGLRVKVQTSASGGSGQAAGWLNAVVNSDTTVSDTFVDIGTSDGFTAGTGTAAPTTSTSYLGGSYRAVTISAGAGNLIDRLNGALPSAPPVGRYKVLLRCEADPIDSITANRYSFAFGQFVNSAYRYGTTVFLDTPAPVSGRGVGAYAFQGWVDLGDFTFPMGVTTPQGYSATLPLPNISLKIGTPAANAGAVRVDGFKLIPVDGPTVRSVTMLKTGLESSINNFDNGVYALDNTLTATWDGDTELFWENKVSGGALVEGGAAVHQGGFPVADPASAQIVLLSFPTSRGRNSATNTAATGFLGQWTLDVSYYPRYLHIGDGT